MFLKPKLNLLISLRSSFFALVHFLFKHCRVIAKRASFANCWFPFAHFARPFCSAIKGAARAFLLSWPFFFLWCIDHGTVFSRWTGCRIFLGGEGVIFGFRAVKCCLVHIVWISIGWSFLFLRRFLWRFLYFGRK